MSDDNDIPADGKWLRSIGATRPMAVASETVYTLGRYQRVNGGCYPLLFRGIKERTEGGTHFAGLMMSVYGVEMCLDATRGCVRRLCAGMRIRLNE